jgi:hypothetical protein
MELGGHLKSGRNVLFCSDVAIVKSFKKVGRKRSTALKKITGYINTCAECMDKKYWDEGFKEHTSV